MLSILLSTILNAKVCFGETEAGRGIVGERGGGSAGISDRVRERRGGCAWNRGADAGTSNGSSIGSWGTCGESRFGKNRTGEGSGELGGNFRGGRLIHGDPRDPLRSFSPIITFSGGGDIGGSSSAPATTTSGWFIDSLSSLESEATDLLKKFHPFSISASARFTNGKLSDSSEVDLRTGNSVSLSRFLGLHRSKPGSPDAATVSETCLVSAACFTESDLERGSRILGVGERRSPNFLLAALFIEEKSPSFS